MQRDGGERLTGFELFSDFCLELVLRHFPGSIAPLATRAPHYALVELSDLRANGRAAAVLEESLGAALEAREIGDGMISRQDNENGIGIALDGQQSRNRHRRRRVATDWFEDDAGTIDSQLLQLLGGEESVVVIAHHDRGAEVGQSLQTG